MKKILLYLLALMLFVRCNDGGHDRPLQQNKETPVKIKAAGGIHTLEDAAEFLSEGADRLGTSAIVGIAEKELDEN